MNMLIFCTLNNQATDNLTLTHDSLHYQQINSQVTDKSPNLRTHGINPLVSYKG